MPNKSNELKYYIMMKQIDVIILMTKIISYNNNTLLIPLSEKHSFCKYPLNLLSKATSPFY